MEPVIRISGLTKKYGEFTAVNDLNIEIRRNEIFGLLGPNGAGKTTTISMICGLLPPSEGSIKYVGFEGNDYKSLIGYCPQENIFYPKLTCLEQLVFIGILYGLSSKQAENRSHNLLSSLGLSDKTNKKAGSLSGGMKRRLNIALALVHNPEILILDEPEAGLDPQSRILVRDFVKNFGKEKTVILTTHNMDEADRMADRAAIIDYGKLLLVDTPFNLKRSIGEGDMLELIMENAGEEQMNQFARVASGIATLVKQSNNSILFRKKNMIEYLPVIRKLADDAGLAVAEMKLRENSLEDVFIHLTGRELRQ
jgi:ABC-2 type transport system ATP-binding protein